MALASRFCSTWRSMARSPKTPGKGPILNSILPPFFRCGSSAKTVLARAARSTAAKVICWRFRREKASRSSIKWPILRVLAVMTSSRRRASSSSLGGVFLVQDAREAVDGPQRRPQVVGDRVAERLQLLVGCLQLGGALQYPLFEFFVQTADLVFGELDLGDVAGRGERPGHIAGPILEHPAPPGQQPFFTVAAPLPAFHINNVSS